MWKTQFHGGIKLINLRIKSETLKVKWLIDIAENPDLKVNYDIFTRLMGVQRGKISGKSLLFLKKSYM